MQILYLRYAGSADSFYLNECNAILAQNWAKEKGILHPSQLAPFVQPVPFLIAIQPAGGGFAVPSVLPGTAVVLQLALGSLRVTTISTTRFLPYMGRNASLRSSDNAPPLRDEAGFSTSKVIRQSLRVFQKNLVGLPSACCKPLPISWLVFVSLGYALGD